MAAQPNEFVVTKFTASAIRRRVWLLVLGLYALLFGAIARGQPDRPIVYVAPIRGEIDNGLAPYVQRAVREAEAAGASALIVPIDTLGGRVDAAIVMRDALLGARIPTIAFIDPRAISAGALVALASEEIVMTTGATIGAAAPMIAGADGQSAPAGEKATSYVRKEFRATAEARGRNPQLFEAMVDEDVEIPGIIAKGKLLTLTTNEALALGVADDRAESIDEVIARHGWSQADVRTLQPNWAEKTVRFFTSTVVSSLLLGFGMLGLFVEVRTPGFGIPGVVGLACLALFFWSHALVALVGWEEIALVVVGLVLLAIELFVTPGFGVAGVVGAIALLTGLGMSLVGAGVNVQGIVRAATQVSVALLVMLGGAVLLLHFLPRLPFGRALILSSGPEQARLRAPESSPTDLILPGDIGTAASPLRPSGIAEIGGARVDAMSEGEYIAADTPIEVLRIEQNHVIVRRVVKSEPLRG